MEENVIARLRIGPSENRNEAVERFSKDPETKLISVI